jgi:hypothetical protein
LAFSTPVNAAVRAVINTNVSRDVPFLRANFFRGISHMPDPKAPVAPAAKAPAANPPVAAPIALAIDERFAALAADLMSQVDARLETFRQEISTQLSLNVDPLHKDLHDLLDQLMHAATRIEALEAANFVTPEGLKEQAEQMSDAIAEKLASKIPAPVIQPAINVVDPTLADRITKIESRLRFF